MNLLLKSTWNEMIFDHRNRSYGAFVLRKKYDKNIALAMIIAGTVFVLAFVSPKIIDMLTPADATDDFVVEEVVLMDPPPIKPPDPTEPPPPPAPKIPPPPTLPPTVKYVPPKVVPDEMVKEVEEIATVDELKDADPGKKTVEGDPNAKDFVILDDYGDQDKIVEEPKKEEVFTVVEQMPEYPGGPVEMMKFLQKNIKYPKQAASAGIQGNVFVNFVVGKDGTIKDVVIAKGIGYGCDEEALRVVERMPKWNAGKQNGKAVTVKYTIPIRFKLAN